MDIEFEIRCPHVACFFKVLQIFQVPAEDLQITTFIYEHLSSDFSPSLLCPVPVANMYVQAFTRLVAVTLLLLFAGHVLAFPTDGYPGKREEAVPSVDKPTSLLRRLDNQWQSFLAPEGMQISYITYAHLIPVQAAAVGLQHLYQQVMTTAQAYQWTQQTLSNSVTITIGSFTLTLSSTLPITWLSLHAFALKMWLISGSGWVSGYTIRFTAPSGDILQADLRILGSARATTASSSPSKVPASG